MFGELRLVYQLWRQVKIVRGAANQLLLLVSGMKEFEAILKAATIPDFCFKLQRLCGFLHLPCLPDQVTSDRLSGGIDRACPSLPLATMIAAVESILTVTV